MKFSRPYSLSEKDLNAFIEMKNTALILIDIQNGFDDHSYWGIRNNPQAEENASKLLAAWRERKNPVFHVKHNSSNPQSLLRAGQKGNDLKDIVRPLQGERVIEKSVNSAFIGTDLEAILDQSGIKSIVLAGLTTDHCVSTTARMAANFGFDVTVVSDATATFDRTYAGEKFPAELVHQTALASLNGEFATIARTEELLKSNNVSATEK
jgi:nicotinamidase-related amidase